jgi:hypothetical protein
VSARRLRTWPNFGVSRSIRISIAAPPENANQSYPVVLQSALRFVCVCVCVLVERPLGLSPARRISGDEDQRKAGRLHAHTRRARLCVTEPNLWICRSHKPLLLVISHTQKVNEKYMRSWNKNLEVKCLFFKLLFFSQLAACFADTQKQSYIFMHLWH